MAHPCQRSNSGCSRRDLAGDRHGPPQRQARLAWRQLLCPRSRPALRRPQSSAAPSALNRHDPALGGCLLRTTRQTPDPRLRPHSRRPWRNLDGHPQGPLLRPPRPPRRLVSGAVARRKAAGVSMGWNPGRLNPSKSLESMAARTTVIRRKCGPGGSRKDRLVVRPLDSMPHSRSVWASPLLTGVARILHQFRARMGRFEEKCHVKVV